MKFLQFLAYFCIAQTYAAISNPFPDKKFGLPGEGSVTIGPADDTAPFTDFVINIIDHLKDILAIISVLGICIVGVMYMTSHGSEEKTESAKNYFIAILTGLILSVTAWAMISLIDLVPNALNFN